MVRLYGEIMIIRTSHVYSQSKINLETWRFIVVNSEAHVGINDRQSDYNLCLGTKIFNRGILDFKYIYDKRNISRT